MNDRNTNDGPTLTPTIPEVAAQIRRELRRIRRRGVWCKASQGKIEKDLERQLADLQAA